MAFEAMREGESAVAPGVRQLEFGEAAQSRAACRERGSRVQRNKVHGLHDP